MTSLTATTVIWTAVVGFGCVVAAVLGRPRPRLLQACLVASGIAAGAVAAGDLVRIVVGPRPIELATHLGYLVTTPLLLPVTAAFAGGDRGRWGSACFAVASAVLVVVLLRLTVTSHG